MVAVSELDPTVRHMQFGKQSISARDKLCEASAAASWPNGEVAERLPLGQELLNTACLKTHVAALCAALGC
jgi:hypothetical protein